MESFIILLVATVAIILLLAGIVSSAVFAVFLYHAITHVGRYIFGTIALCAISSVLGKDCNTGASTRIRT